MDIPISRETLGGGGGITLTHIIRDVRYSWAIIRSYKRSLAELNIPVVDVMEKTHKLYDGVRCFLTHYIFT